VYSQISPLAREHTWACCATGSSACSARPTCAVHAAGRHRGVEFVYLDMEEYRDKELTAERSCARSTAQDCSSAGRHRAAELHPRLASHAARAAGLGAPARRRRRGRITIRLVKGANMESERAESSMRGWPQAPYRTKLETDANYKRMVHAVMQPENLAAMDVGVASHNLFDLAYGLVLAHERNALDKVQFEMLEGMANAQRRALFELTRNLLLYAPACRKENFINAIGYLIRRLDENTGPENFLRHAFKIEVDSPSGAGSSRASSPRSTRSAHERRPAPRPGPQPAPVAPPAVARGWQHLENEPDTDFATATERHLGREDHRRVVAAP